MKSAAKKIKRALITGATGQDGSYLIELLLEKGYEVHGIVRRASTFNRARIEHLYDFEDRGRLKLHYGDLTDFGSIISILEKIRPDEIYNLAAQSHVQISFDIPLYTAQTDGIGSLNLFEAIRVLKLPAKIYQASTSELYSGDPKECPQNEETPFKPRSPYGVAKLFAFHSARIYRESFGMFVVNGILFNHESPRRGENFVTRKIAIGLAEIKNGKRDFIRLGNLDAKRDWGHAKDYVRAMHLMLQQKTPKDYVIATGEEHTVREFAELACREIGLEVVWKGKGVNEVGLDKKTGKKIIAVDPKFFRPNEVNALKGDARKAAKDLGWKPEISFKSLVKEMIDAEFKS